jgi:hypothetical protein
MLVNPGIVTTGDTVGAGVTGCVGVGAIVTGDPGVDVTVIPVTPWIPVPIPAPLPTRVNGAEGSEYGMGAPFFLFAMM